MPWKDKMQGGVLGFAGFMLSPLSWWNDAFVNIPLAVGFGWVVARFHRAAFEPAVIVGYWLTNVLGLVLMHAGAQKVLSTSARRYSRRDLVRDFAVSLGYTLLIGVLIWLKVLRPFEYYFPEK